MFPLSHLHICTSICAPDFVQLVLINDATTHNLCWRHAISCKLCKKERERCGKGEEFQQVHLASPADEDVIVFDTCICLSLLQQCNDAMPKTFPELVLVPHDQVRAPRSSLE